MRSTDMSWDERAQADPGRLWAGGVVTALVAAGVALVGVLLVHKLPHASLLSFDGTKEPADDAKTMLPILAAVAALVATGLLHLLMTTTPRAGQFFAWIGALVLALVVLELFVAGDDKVSQFVTSAFYVLIGIVIISSLFGVSRTAVRYRRRQDYRDDYSGRDQAYGRQANPYPDGYGGQDPRHGGYVPETVADPYPDGYADRPQAAPYRDGPRRRY